MVEPVPTDEPTATTKDYEYEKSVADMLAAEKGMDKDVAEMLVAAQMMPTSPIRLNKLIAALRTMDKMQRHVANTYETVYDHYLDLYPAWRLYVQADAECRQNRLDDYTAILGKFTDSQNQLLDDLAMFMELQLMLLPPNVYGDAGSAPSIKTVDLLEDFPE